MTRTLRRTIFYLLTAIFIIAGTGIVLYAQGWRWDFKNWQPVKVGGIYIRSFPPEAQIFLDGKPIKNKSGFLQSGTLISDLFPKNYRLRLVLDGFRPLERGVDVRPAMVTEEKYIVLIPEKPDLLTSGPIQDFWLLDEPVLLTQNNELLYRGQKIQGSRALDWTDSFSAILTTDEKGGYFINMPESATSTALAPLFRKLGLKTTGAEITLDPENRTMLVYGSPSALYLVDTSRSRLITISSSSPTSTAKITAASPSVFWLAWASFDNRTGSSTLTIYDKLLGNKRPVPESITGRTLKIKWFNNDFFGFLQENGEFFTYRPGETAVTNVASDVKDFKFSPDGNMVAVLAQRSLEIISFRNNKDYWRFNLPAVEQIQAVAWHKDNRHLFLTYSDKTVFLDLDDASLDNLDVLAPTAKAEYSPAKNELYYLWEEKMLRLKLPD
ncbi:MAG: PEGA domain-containing protein [Patescibacteria group bacterium]